MSLFVCSKCGCIDNTATSYYWALIRPCKNRIYDKSLKGYEGKPLCSECAAIEYSKGGEVVVVPGTWHGLRHCSIISQLAAYGIAHKNRSVQGFLTSKNRFLTREEASELVRNNNQEMVVDRNAIREQLYSEDLY